MPPPSKGQRVDFAEYVRNRYPDVEQASWGWREFDHAHHLTFQMKDGSTRELVATPEEMNGHEVREWMKESLILPPPSRHGQYYDARQYTKPRRRVAGQPQRYGPARIRETFPTLLIYGQES